MTLGQLNRLSEWKQCVCVLYINDYYQIYDFTRTNYAIIIDCNFSDVFLSIGFILSFVAISVYFQLWYVCNFRLFKNSPFKIRSSKSWSMWCDKIRMNSYSNSTCYFIAQVFKSLWNCGHEYVMLRLNESYIVAHTGRTQHEEIFQPK